MNKKLKYSKLVRSIESLNLAATGAAEACRGLAKQFRRIDALPDREFHGLHRHQRGVWYRRNNPRPKKARFKN